MPDQPTELTWNDSLFWDDPDPNVTWDGFLAPAVQNSPEPKKKTMSLTTTEVFGFADTVQEAMTSNAAELATKGVTVTDWITEGKTMRDDVITKNDEQENAKTALKNKTIATNAALQATYDFYSTKLDAMAGAFGKKTPKAKQLLRLRSDIRRGSTSPTPPPPTP